MAMTFRNLSSETALLLFFAFSPDAVFRVEWGSRERIHPGIGHSTIRAAKTGNSYHTVGDNYSTQSTLAQGLLAHEEKYVLLNESLGVPGLL